MTRNTDFTDGYFVVPRNTSVNVSCSAMFRTVLQLDLSPVLLNAEFALLFHTRV